MFRQAAHSLGQRRYPFLFIGYLYLFVLVLKDDIVGFVFDVCKRERERETVSGAAEVSTLAGEATGHGGMTCY